MVTKAIIKRGPYTETVGEVKTTKYDIYVPVFEQDVFDIYDLRQTIPAKVCVPQGYMPVFSEEDAVIVAFEDNDIADPVIIGQLFISSDNTISESDGKTKKLADLNLNSLKVLSEAILPSNTTIGGKTFESIINGLSERIDDITNQISDFGSLFGGSDYDDSSDGSSGNNDDGSNNSDGSNSDNSSDNSSDDSSDSTSDNNNGNGGDSSNNGDNSNSNQTYSIFDATTVTSKVVEYGKSKDANKKLSDNFKVREFACKCPSEDGCKKNCGCSTVKIDDRLVAILQSIRTYFGAPLIINSGYRCETHNSHVGGVTGSNHMRGTAADIRISDIEPREIAEYAVAINVPHLIVYKTFVHIDSADHSVKNGETKVGYHNRDSRAYTGAKDVYKKGLELREQLISEMNAKSSESTVVESLSLNLDEEND